VRGFSGLSAVGLTGKLAVQSRRKIHLRAGNAGWSCRILFRSKCRIFSEN
jgi:hypothetical protein